MDTTNNNSGFISIDQLSGGGTGSATGGSWVTIQGNANYDAPGVISYNLNYPKGSVRPELYFKYIKRKFGTLEEMRLKTRLKKLEKAFLKAVDDGQDALGEKILRDLGRHTRESVLYSKGIRHFIEHDDLHKYKRSIQGGHISDTRFKDYTRVIPEDVLKKKAKVNDLFDDFVIFHYYNAGEEEKREKKQKMSQDEKAKMKDPVLFGRIRESTRWYFIADWEDEFCDLSFDDIVDYIGKDDDEVTLHKEPDFINNKAKK